MTHHEATAMIQHGVQSLSSSELWLDLGSGSGVFTRALAGLLNRESTVYAIDKDSFVEMPSTGAAIVQWQLDFVRSTIPVAAVDGILMANSFHYVEDKAALLANLRSVMKPTARLIVVEYDTARATAWVPYPIGFTALQKLLSSYEFTSVTKVAERPSVYGSTMMYAALAC